MIKRWLFGRKYRITASVYMGKAWNPVKRYFWSGGLFTGHKVNVMRILLGWRCPVRKTFYVDDMVCNRLGSLGDRTFPQFLWPKGLWDG